MESNFINPNARPIKIVNGSPILPKKKILNNTEKLKLPSKYIMENPDCKKFTKSVKTEFSPKPYPTAGDRYLQQQEKIRQLENSARTRSTGYRPLDNNPKGGFERAMDKMRQLGETKAELTEKSAKITKKFAKILEFCKKYGKSIKA